MQRKQEFVIESTELRTAQDELVIGGGVLP